MSVRMQLPKEFLNAEAKCSLCGRDEWTAEWMGHIPVRVCRACAEERLPRLLADAVWCRAISNYGDLASLERVLDRVRAEFWRAVAINVLRERQPITHVLDSGESLF